MFLVAVPLSMSLATLAATQPDKLRVDQQLVVEFAQKTVTVNPQGFIFQHAQATYGPSVLTADTLTVNLDPGHKHFIAEGHVHILDIDGTLDADRIEMDWATHVGSGQNVHLNLQGLMVDAASAVINKKLCELDDVFATPCGNEKQELIAIKAPKAIIDSAGDIHIYKPRLYLGGKKVLTLKEYTISPNRRSASQPLPSLGYSHTSGVSGSWVPGIQLTDTLQANGSIHLGQTSIPSEDLLISQSLLPMSQTKGSVVPYSDFAEHFGYSYFENVYVSDPVQERFFVSARRESLSVGTVWNEYPGARLENDRFNKPLELVYEAAGSIAGLGTYAQLRTQKVEEVYGPNEIREEAFTSVALPDYDIVPHLYTDIRFDGFASIGNAKPYGWGHAQFGLVARPAKVLRLGAAYTRGENFGSPLFVTDELYRNESFNVRADLLLGPQLISLLLKYDPGIHDWYDTEIQFAQAVGCFEPYVIYRAFPRGVIFGLRLRLDNVTEALKRRGAIKSGPVDTGDR